MIKSIKPIPFSGKEADWNTWAFQFRNQVSLAGLAHMLREAKVEKPAYALVKLFSCLVDSMPMQWLTKFSTLPMIQLPEEKEMTIYDDTKPEKCRMVPIPEEDRVSTFPIAHPALCFQALQKYYERSDEVTVNALWAQLDSCKMGESSFDVFLQKLTILFNRLTASGEVLSEVKMKRCLLTGVTRDSSSMVSMIENRQGLTFTQLVARFQDFYERRELQARYEPQGETVSRPPLAFSSMNEPSEIPLCTICRKGRHLQRDCWQIHPEKKPQRFMSVQSKVGQKDYHPSQMKCSTCRHFGHTADECRLIPRPAENRPSNVARAPPGLPRGTPPPPTKESSVIPKPHQVPGRSTDLASNGALRKNAFFVQHVALFSADSGSTTPPMVEKQVIMDSAASAHFCNQRELFYEFHELSSPVRVDGVGWEEIRFIGSIILSLNINGSVVHQRFKNVFFAPFLRFSLLSCGVMSEFGVSFSMNDDELLAVYDQELVLTASRQERLYVVDCFLANSFNAAAFARSLFNSFDSPVISDSDIVEPARSEVSTKPMAHNLDTPFPTNGAHYQAVNTFLADFIDAAASSQASEEPDVVSDFAPVSSSVFPFLSDSAVDTVDEEKDVAPVPPVQVGDDLQLVPHETTPTPTTSVPLASMLVEKADFKKSQDPPSDPPSPRIKSLPSAVSSVVDAVLTPEPLPDDFDPGGSQSSAPVVDTNPPLVAEWLRRFSQYRYPLDEVPFSHPTQDVVASSISALTPVHCSSDVWSSSSVHSSASTHNVCSSTVTPTTPRHSSSSSFQVH